jgi:Domain of unknown function (DUF1929)
MPWRTDIIDSEIFAVHLALVPSATAPAGKILMFGGSEQDGAQAEPGGNFRRTRLFDVATRTVVPGFSASPDSDVFCSGHAFLGDGRLLIGGGTFRYPDADEPHNHLLGFFGHRRCWVFNPRAEAWQEVAQLNAEPGQTGGGGRWYPALITMSNGDVSTFFGHPMKTASWHRNVQPERFSIAEADWEYLDNMMAPPFFEPGETVNGIPVQPNFFARGHVLPGGRLFFASPLPSQFTLTPAPGNEGAYSSSFVDPNTAAYVGAPIASPGNAFLGWDRPSVLLPLLPDESYRPRVLFVGANDRQARRIDLDPSNPSPAWVPTTQRDEQADNNYDRVYCCAILLPTAEVLVVGGMKQIGAFQEGGAPELGFDAVEIYRPGINFDTGLYQADLEGWTTRESATRNRSYHSSALLMPDGRVLTAGGNYKAGFGPPREPIPFPPGTPDIGSLEIEIYEPDYIAVPGRPSIANSPRSVSYGQTFTIEMAAPAAGHRVAMIRCGSMTHAWDADQRYVALRVTATNGNVLTVQAPPDGNVAPPGYYTLWVISANGPCELARFVRLSDQTCSLVADRNTFSVDEVGGGATFTSAFFVVFERFLPSELPPGQPTPTLTVTIGGAPVPGTDIEITAQPGMQDELTDPNRPDRLDAPRRIVFSYDVRFHNATAFAGLNPGDLRDLTLRMDLGHHSCTGRLQLIAEPNPFVLDGNPHWLSTDVRVFTLREGQGLAALGLPSLSVSPVSGPGDAARFITDVMTAFDTFTGAVHPFTLLNADNTELQISRSDGVRVYNFGVTRVHYRGQTVPAPAVRVFFRLFTTLASGLQFDRNTRYRRFQSASAAISLLGVGDGSEIVSIPFFAEPREATAAPATGSMQNQTDTGNVKAIPSSPPESQRYFGCWLDFNQTEARFPGTLPATNPDGPYGSAVSIQELLRGEHQCLIAEVLASLNPPELIAFGQGPEQSDKLAQRNLTIQRAENPGNPATRTVQHTFDLKLSTAPDQGPD